MEIRGGSLPAGSVSGDMCGSCGGWVGTVARKSPTA